MENRVLDDFVPHISSHVFRKCAADSFDHLFKRETGMSIHQYINKVRTRNAENMLKSGNYKVEEIAEHCGLSDVFRNEELNK
jgi:AraC-like DNA-binding protein